MELVIAQFSQAEVWLWPSIMTPRNVVLAIGLGLVSLSSCSRGNGAGAGTASISGVITGASVAGVAIQLSGPTAAATTTNETGNYSFTDLRPGSYVVTPTAAGFTFTPPSISVEAGAAPAFANFAKQLACPAGSGRTCGTPNEICGTLTGDVVANVNVFLNGFGAAQGTDRTAVTDASGNYSFSDLPNGIYLLQPFAGRGFILTPQSSSVTLDGSCVAPADFANAIDTSPCATGGFCSSQRLICGTLALDTADGGLAGALVNDVQSLPGSSPPPLGSEPSDVLGRYWIPELMRNGPVGTPDAPGTDVVTPVLLGFRFTPPSRTVTFTGSCVPDVDFVATPVPVISSTLTVIGPQIQSPISFTATNLATGAVATSTAIPGAGSFAVQLDDGGHGTYVVAPAASDPPWSGYTFSPESATVTVGDANVTATDFTASPKPFFISGTVNVTPFAQAPAGPFVVQLSGDATASFTVGVSQPFIFPGLPDGQYTLTLTGAGFITPSSRRVVIQGANVPNEDFDVGFPGP